MSTETPKKRRGARPKTERNKQFAADYDAGMSVEELSAKYGLKPSSVQSMVMQFRRNGLITRQADRRPDRNAERNAEIVRRYETEDITVRALAEEYGMTPVNMSIIIRNAAMRKETANDPFVTVKIRLSDAQRFIKHRRADAEHRGMLTLPPDVQPLVEACESTLPGQ